MIKQQVRLDVKLACAMRAKEPWPDIIYFHLHKNRGGNNQMQAAYRGGSGKAAVDSAAHAIYMSGHRDFSARFPNKIQRGEDYRRMISGLLGLELEASFDDRDEIIGHLSNRPFSGDDLSEGQQRGLGLIEVLIDHADEIRGSILLIDEPETHLHPDALINVFDRLLALNPAQVFVATHSVPLLAHIGVKSVYHLQNGKPRWSGNAPVEMLCGLLGDKKGISEIRTFIDGASSLAFHQFAAESLMPPGVACYRTEDPQSLQAVTRIRQRLTIARETQVLDFAAGSGRLIAALADMPEVTRASLSYHVYNAAAHTSLEDTAECRRNLSRIVSGDSLESRYFDDIRALRNPSFKRMDMVILCNVLHEIDAVSWPRLFQDIACTLAVDGTVLILEDQEMSVGELPHDKGFLVLDKIELQALFNVRSDEAFAYDLAYDGRLSLAEISFDQIRRCDRASVCATLERVRERSLQKIRELRKPGLDSHRSGRLHAYYSLLHTNASLAIENAL